MTSETRVRRGQDATAVDAAEAAARTAGQAGVSLTELRDLAGLQAAAALYQDVWQTDTRAAPVSPDLMRALSHAGGYVAGAYDGDRLVAASLAFHTGNDEAGLHSHISAVAPDVQGRDVGRALKLHQRAWALERGLRTISWTYDPLISRNAWFNVTKLGARAIGYLVDFYGAMDDAQNAGDGGSDRAVALWDLGATYVRDAAAGHRRELDVNDLLRAGALIGLQTDADGKPEMSRVPAGAACVLVQVPDDIQQLRRTDPLLASRWRATSREVLEPLLAGPYVTTGFTRTGWYVLEETPS
ncbi:MAG: GNAT family N-acetyltransferase [Frankiaceae bacterium]|nr:GNAT family N-acetyltransferase [Frankiaceae bacterium]